MNIDKAQIARMYELDHLIILNNLPDDRSEALESLSCFVANCIKSLSVSEDLMFTKIREYVKYYEGN